MARYFDDAPAVRSTRETNGLLNRLRGVVGRRQVLTKAHSVRRYATGFRFGTGEVFAVVRPRSLVEFWRASQVCVEGGAIIIVQAANTGLTGGSTPHGAYDRPVVILSVCRIDGIHVLNGGSEVVCLAGATLHALEGVLRPLGREPHSVIGSSCIGASVVGGICNNSGGALVQRGPAFTQYALYGQIGADGNLRLVNHLGIELGDDPEEMLARLDTGSFELSDIPRTDGRSASDTDYVAHVRDTRSDRPARFNADPRNLFEASGCAGKLIVFAVRLDTFDRPTATQVFYIGTNKPSDLAHLRKAMLESLESLPITAEYIHREALDVAARYGKDTMVAIRMLGTRRLPVLFACKAFIDSLAQRMRLGGEMSDLILQALATVAPFRIPRRIATFRNRYEHHLLLRFAGKGAAEAEAWLEQNFAGGYFTCSEKEAETAFLLRFAVAGAAVRYRAIHKHEVEDIIALDVALPRNCVAWLEQLPPEFDGALLHKLYYGHFFCHVFHQDYVVKRGMDLLALKSRMLASLDARGAEYPAEHNVGHLYEAKPALAAFYRSLDPRNQLNPGIGKTPRAADWQSTFGEPARHAHQVEQYKPACRTPVR